MKETSEKKVIGRGTWIDKIAYEMLEREKTLERKSDVIRTESGLGASGFPHVGSLADCARAYAIKLAVEDLGLKSEYIAFSDDMDGLRKVPAGLPEDQGSSRSAGSHCDNRDYSAGLQPQTLR